MSNDNRKAAGASGGAVYGLGLIGAAVYYFQQASDFWSYVFALPKAIVWPAFVIYDLLGHLA
jgi:hypothetical protein